MTVSVVELRNGRATAAGVNPGVAPRAPAGRRWLHHAAFWAMMLAGLLAGWGVRWDIEWHRVVGRDSFWIAPHAMMYAGVVLTFVASVGGLLYQWIRRAAVTGFLVAALGVTLSVVAAPIDDLWHRLVGPDSGVWSPPHLLALVGSTIISIGGVIVAREIHPVSSSGRLLAAVVASGQLFGQFTIILTPTLDVAFVRGGPWFHMEAVLSALLLPMALIPVVWSTGRTASPIYVVVLVTLVGLAGDHVSTAGFALTRPVPMTADEIAQHPMSQVALTNEIARRDGVSVGTVVSFVPPRVPDHSAGSLRDHVGAIPGVTWVAAAAVMTLLDPRRRPLAATVGYAVALFAMSGWLRAGRPAFQPVVPGTLDTLIALVLTLAAAVMGGVLARGLAARVGR
jgi:hypothetical protein